MMLCPCCGGEMLLGALGCDCGAKFVGEPLGEPAVKLQRFGPPVTAVSLLVIVVVAALIVTKFFALGAILVIWAARRAMRLARLEPEGYGGYRTAAATLAVTVAAGTVSAGFAVAYIPKLIQDRKDRQTAANYAVMHHSYKLLDDYKRQYGSYPPDELKWKQVMSEPLPRDFWNNKIAYQGYTEAIADASPKDSSKRGGIAINNFELRSAGPDEKLNTDDDIIMIDGVFYTNAEARKKSVMQGPVRR